MGTATRKGIVWVWATIFALSAGLFGQGSSEGTITGTVTDASGAPVAGVQVQIRNVQTNASRETRSGSIGEFTVPTLPVGTYELSATAPGFQTVHVRDIKL